MKKFALASALMFATPVLAQSPVPVTVDTFIRAETDRYFAANSKEAGGLGKFHHRPRTGVGRQPDVIRFKSRHALFVRGVRSRGRAGNDHAAQCRQALHVADDRRRRPLCAVRCLRQQAAYAHSKEHRHALCVRGDPHPRRSQRPQGRAEVHTLQDAIKVSQPGGPGKLEVPNWDQRARRRFATPCWCWPGQRPIQGAFGRRMRSTRSTI